MAVPDGKSILTLYLIHSKKYTQVSKISISIIPGHGCQTTLLRLLEDWRNALEKNQYVAAVLMDLSKAFDCLPHDILLDKLSAYGMSTDSVSLLESHLSSRKQQIKINGILSSWSDIQQGVPQGSILSLYFLMSLLMIFFIL